MGTSRSDDGDISPFEFETQARSFDARAGLGAEAALAVGHAIVRLLAIGPTDPLLEIGAGTGEVGVVLAASTRGYVGLDASAAMLEVFRERARPNAPRLVTGDANETWPIADRSLVGLYFARVLHLLDPAHVRAEIARVASEQGLSVLVGRRRRAPESPSVRVRRRLHALLEAEGIEPKRGERADRAFIDDFVAAGATPIPPVVASETEVSGSLRHAIDRFRTKSGIAGLTLPRTRRDTLLASIEAHFEREGEALDAVVPSVERFVLEGFRLGPRANR